jgi:hypothetical protein
MPACGTYSFHHGLANTFVQNILYGLLGISTLWLLSHEPTGHLIGNWHPNPTTLAFPIPWVFHPEKICTKETWDPKHPIKEFFKWPRSAHRSPNSLVTSHTSRYSIPSKWNTLYVPQKIQNEFLPRLNCHTDRSQNLYRVSSFFSISP